MKLLSAYLRGAGVTDAVVEHVAIAPFVVGDPCVVTSAEVVAGCVVVGVAVVAKNIQPESSLSSMHQMDADEDDDDVVIDSLLHL